MTTKEFYKLVEEMRASQKLYFKSRSVSALHTSIALEKQVDEEIARYNERCYGEIQLAFEERE